MLSQQHAEKQQQQQRAEHSHRVALLAFVKLVLHCRKKELFCPGNIWFCGLRRGYLPGTADGCLPLSVCPSLAEDDVGTNVSKARMSHMRP